MEPRASRSSVILPLVAGLMLASLAGYVGWMMGTAEGRDVGAAAEYPAILTDFRVPTLDDRKLGPPDFRGQVVVVDFWATWCGPCRVQAKILEPLWEEFKAQGVQFLAVSLGETRETVEKYIAHSPYAYPVLYDTEDRIATEAEIYALPTVMVIDRSGKVSYLKPGLSDAPAVRQAVESARL